ncbi:MAG: DUF2085 domain-containing protein [bacterium]
MDRIIEFIYRFTDTIGYAVCHRLSERSPLFNSHQFMVCHRCAGTYLGALSAYIYIFIKFRGSPIKLPNLKYGIFLIIFISTIFIDVAGTLIGIIPDRAPLRTLTGALTGSSIALLAYSLLCPYEKEKDAKPILERPIDLIIILIASFLITILVNSELYTLFIPLTILTSIGILSIFFNTFYLITTTISDPKTLMAKTFAIFISIVGIALFLTLLWHLHRITDCYIQR